MSSVHIPKGDRIDSFTEAVQRAQQNAANQPHNSSAQRLAKETQRTLEQVQSVERDLDGLVI